jgi:hypothetical protein
MRCARRRGRMMSGSRCLACKFFSLVQFDFDLKQCWAAPIDHLRLSSVAAAHLTVLHW